MAVKVEYRGGIPEANKTGTVVADAFPDYLSVGAAGFSLKSFKIPYTKMSSVELVPEGAKKKNYVLNVEYVTDAGFNSVVVLSGKEVSALYGALQKARQKYAQSNRGAAAMAANAPEPAPAVDVAAEIEKFHALKEKGVISEDDFNAKKAQLLGI